MARLLLSVAMILGWIAARAAAHCPVSMTRLGTTTKRGPVKTKAGSKVRIVASVRTTQAVKNAVVALFLPAELEVLKWSTTLRGGAAPIIDGQVSGWVDEKEESFGGRGRGC